VRLARLVCLTVAAALGVGGRVLVRIGWELPRGDDLALTGAQAKALGAPWLAGAWGLGAVAGSRLRGALAGAAGLVLGTLAWYFVSLALSGAEAVAWSLAAGAGGAAFGLAGALWRDGNPTVRAVGIASWRAHWPARPCCSPASGPAAPHGSC
jgi:hypothetical protein